MTEKGDSRRAALDALWQLVDDSGLEGVTIAAVTAASGVSNGSLYHHFGGRAGLVEALFGEVFARCMSELAEMLDDGPAERNVRSLAGGYLTWVAARPGPARVLYAVDAGRLVASSPAVQEAKAQAFGPVLAWFETRAAAGEVRAWPAWALDAVVMAPAHECARRYLATLDGPALATMRGHVEHAVWALARPAPAA